MNSSPKPIMLDTLLQTFIVAHLVRNVSAQKDLINLKTIFVSLIRLLVLVPKLETDSGRADDLGHRICYNDRKAL